MKLLLSLILLGAAANAQMFPFPGPVVLAAGGGGFLHSRSLTINPAQVGSGDLTDFTVTVVLALGSSKIQNASCFDVVFAADTANVTPYPWFMESCNQGTGAVIAKVKVPSVSHTVNTVFYALYDNAAISIFQSTGSVWDASTKGVWLLSDGTTLDLTDALGINNLSVTAGTVNATTGQVDGAAIYVGGNTSSMGKTSPTGLPTSGGITIEAWIFWSSAGGGTTYFSQYSDYSGSASSIISFAGSTIPGTDRIQSFINNSGYYSGAVASRGSWHHVAMVFNSPNMNMYVDGVDSGLIDSGGSSATCCGGAFTFNSSRLIFGGLDGTSLRPDNPSKQDQPIIAATARTAGWVLARYNNEKTGSSFITVGSEI